jgi:hypothetical protein
MNESRITRRKNKQFYCCWKKRIKGEDRRKKYGENKKKTLVRFPRIYLNEPFTSERVMRRVTRDGVMEKLIH